MSVSGARDSEACEVDDEETGVPQDVDRGVTMIESTDEKCEQSPEQRSRAQEGDSPK
jgi:hypothetical protein